MKIENESLLDQFRTPGPCELCGRFAPIREPHHLRCKGFGGGATLDVRINLVAVGSSRKKTGQGFRKFTCHCHKLAHAHKIDADFILAIVARREFARMEEITEVMDFFARTIRPTGSQLDEAIGGLSPGARLLAIRELAEAGIRTFTDIKVS